MSLDTRYPIFLTNVYLTKRVYIECTNTIHLKLLLNFPSSIFALLNLELIIVYLSYLFISATLLVWMMLYDCI